MTTMRKRLTHIRFIRKGYNMTKIEVYDFMAEKLEKIAEAHDVTVAELIDMMAYNEVDIEEELKEL